MTSQLIESAILAAEKTAFAKALDAGNGWLFLVNDTNDNLRYLFGSKNWSQQETEKAFQVIEDRIKYFSERNIKYFNFIIPEKAAFYQENLPEPFSHVALNELRPSKVLSNKFPHTVHYLLPDIIKYKPLGNLFYRGDTHMNRLGSYFLYKGVLNILSKNDIIDPSSILNLKKFRTSIVSYDGDLFNFMTEQEVNNLRERYQAIHGEHGFEQLIEYNLAKSEIKHVETDYNAKFSLEREVIATEKDVSNGIRALFFRGSTLINCYDLFAQHFARSLFVWHQGEIIGNFIEQEEPNIVIDMITERFLATFPARTPIVKL